MSRQTFLYTIAITLHAPILTQSSGALGFGLDSAMLRDDHDRPALPGTLIKGNLRQAWARLAEYGSGPPADRLKDWLGQPSPPAAGQADDGDNQPRRGALTFDPWFADQAWQPGDTARRYRISVDAATGAVADGMLQVIESPWPAGQAVVFTGTARARIPADQRDPLRAWLERGLNLVPALGALKGNGFGRVDGVKVTVAPQPAQPRPLAGDLARHTRVGLRVRPLMPFCFARPAPGNRNHIDSEAFIPGGALIGAIARRVHEAPQSWPALAASLAQLHCTHARPAKAAAMQRPILPTLGIAAFEDHFADLITAATLPSGDAPRFMIDWKPAAFAKVITALAGNSQPDGPQRRLRLRNEIDWNDGTAKEGVLFSQEIILPDGCDWLANLDLGATADPAACLRELATLLSEPLTHLGKTKAVAKVTIEAAFAPTIPRRRRAPDQVVLVLQSPARLLPADLVAPPTNGDAALQAAYAASWQTLSDGSLALIDSLSALTLRGGRHWWKRFRQPVGETCYRPQLFSEAGSVFRLHIRDATRAAALLDDWVARGLPQLPDAPGGEQWDRNPWLRTNGYGEVLLDPDLTACLRGITP